MRTHLLADLKASEDSLQSVIQAQLDNLEFTLQQSGDLLACSRSLRSLSAQIRKQAAAVRQQSAANREQAICRGFVGDLLAAEGVQPKANEMYTGC